MLIQGSSAAVDDQLQQPLATEGPRQTYFRFQLELTQDAQRMDDTRASLDRLCDLLTATS
jgi:hypothetical protein